MYLISYMLERKVYACINAETAERISIPFKTILVSRNDKNIVTVHLVDNSIHTSSKPAIVTIHFCPISYIPVTLILILNIHNLYSSHNVEASLH
ncbi:hypothetical protein VNO77_33292 [Canavalia gladiata]|uniref:Uncharacterized protein n=1 Tax=Canavalia gladiata TaxID=3824 RepID=A0AAN9PYS2_CANGL